MEEKQTTNNKHLNFDTDKKKVGSVGDKNMYVYFLIITSKTSCNNVSYMCSVWHALFISCSTCFLGFFLLRYDVLQSNTCNVLVPFHVLCIFFSVFGNYDFN